MSERKPLKILRTLIYTGLLTLHDGQGELASVVTPIHFEHMLFMHILHRFACLIRFLQTIHLRDSKVGLIFLSLMFAILLSVK